jgi:nicotinamidase-related amidase
MKWNPRKTALLTLDFQTGILEMVPGAPAVLPAAAKAVEFARQEGWRIIHVGLGFAPGHPEIPATQPVFARLREKNLFVQGTPSAAFHPAIWRPDDLVVYKQRVGAFSENHLHLILRAGGIETLVFFGISTSGITLSTLRRAFDLDYQCVVVKDACFDPDAVVHRVLTEKVFPRQARVLTVDEFIAGTGGAGL